MDKIKTGYRAPLLITFLLFTISLMLLLPSSSWSSTNIRITVKTILASENGNSVDPGLNDIVRELQSLFRYSSYKFLGEKGLSLSLNSKGVVSLPEQITMNISSKGIEGDRAVLDIEILRGGNRILQTVIKLRNNSSINIGGPEYKGGNLLFNIFASF
ncbi:MAG: hypothetical protein JW927_10590 [Deltaproteobacteria bacterium]|nr:hypothetical protein [Deltaproteobacteria bacterium]